MSPRMDVEHHCNPRWIREHLRATLTDRPCYITLQEGEPELHRAYWPLIDTALPKGTLVHVRYEVKGRQCGFFTVVGAGHGGMSVLEEPVSLALVTPPVEQAVEQPVQKAA